MNLKQELDRQKIIAILRGLTLAEAVDVGEVLLAHDITVMEVTLNSPDACQSIARMTTALQGRAVVGAGTVTEKQQVQQVVDHGASFCISPNTNPDVIEACLQHQIIPMPGCLTPTEAFQAVAYGAKHLKLFPATSVEINTIKAWKSVLPKHIKVYAVGGVDETNAGLYLSKKADGLGIGSSLYSSGVDLQELDQRAKSIRQSIAEYTV
ncbi:MAG: 2-dehydro-3-deoxy-6-phosphogalactonate aldolase [Bdellovibrionota bacterium]|nr:2-dehydro-3-deoxy-6-phosphogalactonate aldolase [Deltaproteobacteria bacterium]